MLLFAMQHMFAIWQTLHACTFAAESFGLPHHNLGHALMTLQRRSRYLDLGVEGVNVTVDLHEVHVDQVEALACQGHLLLGKLDQHLLVRFNDSPQLCDLHVANSNGNAWGKHLTLRLL